MTCINNSSCFMADSRLHYNSTALKSSHVEGEGVHRRSQGPGKTATTTLYNYAPVYLCDLISTIIVL